MLVILALSTLGHAQDFVTDWGDPQIWEQGGVWSRPIPVDGAWRLGMATQSDFWIADLVQGDEFGEWELDRESKANLTNRGNLQDNSIKRCPDGSYLIGSSASVDAPNDSSYWTWVDSDWNPIANGAVEETSNERPHNDLVVVCSPIGTGVLHSNFGGAEAEFTSVLFSIDPEDGVTGQAELFDYKSEGGAIIHDTRDDTFVVAHVSLFFEGAMGRFSPELTNLESKDVDFVDGDWKENWSQGLIRIGDYFMVATLARDEEVYGRGEGGEVWVVVMDDDFEVLQRERLTWFLDDEESGANRPWIDRKGGQALVGFDKGNKLGVIEVALDLSAFGVEEGEDTGGGGSGSGSGSGSTGDDGDSGDPSDGDADGGKKSGGCGGCAVATPAPVAAVLITLLALARRRA